MVKLQGLLLLARAIATVAVASSSEAEVSELEGKIMTSKIDNAIRKSEDFKRIVKESDGDVVKAHTFATYATTGRIKEFVEEDRDVRIRRVGKVDAVTHKHVVRVILDEVQSHAQAAAKAGE